MKKKIQALLAVAVVGVLAMGLAGCSSGGNDEGNKGNASGDTANLRFVTGGESGTYYAYGNVLAQYATNGEYGLGVTALVRQRQPGQRAGAGRTTTPTWRSASPTCWPTPTKARTCSKRTSAYKDFSVVAALYQEQVQIVTCNPDIKTGRRPQGRQDRFGGRCGLGRVLQRHRRAWPPTSMTLEDITPVYQSFGDSADSLKDEQDRRGLHRGRRPHHGRHRPVHHQDRLPGLHGPARTWTSC